MPRTTISATKPTQPADPEGKTHDLPPLFWTLVDHIADQPHLPLVQRAMGAAEGMLRLKDTLAREVARQEFVRHAADGESLKKIPSDARTAAQVEFGDP